VLTVTDRFLCAVRESHTVSVVARVYRPSDPDVAIDVPVVGGEVRIDRDARVRRQGTLEVAFTLEDETARDTIRELAFGGEAEIERGIHYANGETERVQLGRFRVESVVWSELQGQATLTLADRFAQVQDEVFTSPYAPAGMTPTDAIVQAVHQVFGDAIAYHIETTPSTEPLIDGTVYDEDRAAAIGDLATSIGAETYFDQLGDFVIRPRDQPATPVWTVDAGPTGAMLAVQETLDRSNVRNGVVVKGQATPDAPPFYVLVVYDDPDALLRWDGPFGNVALVSSSTAVTTPEQATASATAQLNLRLGLARTLVIQSLPNPALEPDDAIAIVFADGRTETQTVNAVQIGLDASATLSITTTSQLRTIPLLAPRRRPRVYTDGAVWEQLADATLVPA
jgi:Domain of unknown function (DUF5047)